MAKAAYTKAYLKSIGATEIRNGVWTVAGMHLFRDEALNIPYEFKSDHDLYVMRKLLVSDCVAILISRTSKRKDLWIKIIDCYVKLRDEK